MTEHSSGGEPAVPSVTTVTAAIQNASELLPHDELATSRAHLIAASNLLSAAFSGTADVQDAITTAKSHAYAAERSLTRANGTFTQYLADVGAVAIASEGAAVSATEHPVKRSGFATLWHVAMNPEVLTNLPKAAADSQAFADSLGVSLHDLAATHVDIRLFRAHPAVRASVRNYFVRTEGLVTLAEVAEAAQKAAIEKAHADRLADHARELLRQHVPIAAPQEPTLTVLASDYDSVGVYFGKFGSAHLLAVSPDGEITPDLLTAEFDENTVAICAHELAHQRHNELLGTALLYADHTWPTLAAYDATPATDSHDVLEQAIQIDAEVSQAVDFNRPAERVKQMVGELYAFAAEEELRVRLGWESIFDAQGNFNAQADFRKAVEYFLGPDSPLRRTGLMEALTKIDLAAISGVPLATQIEALHNPQALLNLPKRQTS